jgi:small subunit ribosomal protein S4
MGKTIDVCQKCRRAGQKLFLKGEKCLSPKCPFTRRSYAPGMHGIKSHPRHSEYAKQLREKQKLIFMYGISERQLRNYWKKAAQKKGATGEMLLVELERRLDNVVYRLGLASSRKEARKLIRDGHLVVNNKKITLPFYQVKTGDKISICEKSKKKSIFSELKDKLKNFSSPVWLKLDKPTLIGEVKALPKRDQIEVPVDESKILEFYSR